MLAALGRAKELGAEYAKRFDLGWYNEITGAGTARDKTAYTQFGYGFVLSDQELANLYHGDDLAARTVDIVPDEMLREGFDVDLGDPTLNTELADALEALNVNDKLANGERWGRLYGRGALLIGADDGRPASTPLVAERAKAVSYLYELDKRYLWPLTYYGEHGHPKLGHPETYLVSPTGNTTDQGSILVHESRLLLFGGATTGLREQQINTGADHSVLQRCFDALRSFNTGWKAVEVLLTDGNQAVIKLQGLAESIGAKGEETVKERLRVMDLYRSVLRAIALDAGDPDTGKGGEDFIRHSVTFSGIPDVMDRMMLRWCAASEAPATILFGRSPAGMNATGESDFRWFYDRIASRQKRKLAPQIRRLVRVMLATKAFGAAKPEAINIKFPALWKETPKTDSERKKLIAETDKLRIESGELLAEEVAVVRAQPDGWDREITLSEEALKARQAILDEGNEGEGAAKTVQLTPSDVAKVITVNEARLSQGLGPLELEGGKPDPDGLLTVAAYAAKQEAAQAVAGEAQGGVEAEEIDPGHEPAPKGPPPFGGGFGGGPPKPEPEAVEAIEAAQERTDAAELVDVIGNATRVVIAGGPRTGKSTLAVRAGERFKRKVRHADSLVGSKEWGDDSEEVARWIDEDGSWIIEGVTAPRALRKWLKTNPGKRLGGVMGIWLRDPIQVQTKAQQSMTKAVATVWNEIRAELAQRGMTIVERDQ